MTVFVMIITIVNVNLGTPALYSTAATFKTENQCSRAKAATIKRMSEQYGREAIYTVRCIESEVK